MTLVLDAGGLTVLAGRRSLLVALRERGQWPAQVPAVVLTEALTGDHRRDFQTNRLLRACQVRDVDEGLARGAATLRTATGRAGTITVTDAVVVALAAHLPDPVVLNTDAGDIGALIVNADLPILLIGV